MKIWCDNCRCRIYGAVAVLEFAEGADRFARRQGLFVLGVQGQERVFTLNHDRFRPLMILPPIKWGEARDRLFPV